MMRKINAKRLANHNKRTYKESSMREVAYTITSGAKKNPPRSYKECSMREDAVRSPLRKKD